MIAADMRAAIQTGTLPARSLLPTVAQLGARHHLAPSTIHPRRHAARRRHLVTVSCGHRFMINYAPVEATHG